MANLLLAAVLAAVALPSLLSVLPSAPKAGIYAGLWLLFGLSLAGVKLDRASRVDAGSGCLCALGAGIPGFILGGEIAGLFSTHSAETYDWRGVELALMLGLVCSLVLWVRFCDLLARRRQKARLEPTEVGILERAQAAQLDPPAR